jgi:hypothetical protein
MRKSKKTKNRNDNSLSVGLRACPTSSDEAIGLADADGLPDGPTA